MDRRHMHISECGLNECVMALRVVVAKGRQPILAKPAHGEPCSAATMLETRSTQARLSARAYDPSQR